MHAKYLLKENIKALLRARKEDASTLASWLNHDKSWINKILNGHREMQIEDFDRVSDFFGIATYQLFQPGISTLTERRISGDRRSGRDRRIGHAHRTMRAVAVDIDGARPKGRDGEQRDRINERVKRLTAEYEQKLSALLAEDVTRRQAAMDRDALTTAPARHRAGSGSHHPPDKGNKGGSS